MKILGSLLLTLYLVSPLVAADIFKCTDAKGNDKYQNFPCPIDSIGSKATAPPPKENTVKHAAQNVAAPPPNLKAPEPGMKMNEVRAGWGVPKSTTVIKGREIWNYDGPSGTTRSVSFDRTGTVLDVTETVGSTDNGESDDEAQSSQ